MESLLAFFPFVERILQGEKICNVKIAQARHGDNSISNSSFTSHMAMRKSSLKRMNVKKISNQRQLFTYKPQRWRMRQKMSSSASIPKIAPCQLPFWKSRIEQQ